MTHKDRELIKKLYLEGKTWAEIVRASGKTKDQCRNFVRNQTWYQPKTQTQQKKVEPTRPKKVVTINNSQTTIEDVVAIKDLSDKDELIRAHGLDPKQWELTQARSSVWQQKEDVTLYASKISVKPKTVLIDVDYIKQAIKDIEPIKPLQKVKVKTVGDYLLLPFYDLHFGNMFYKDYREMLEEIRQILHRGQYKKVLIISGGDLLNADNYTQTTSSGTVLEPVDMTLAWMDAFRFLREIIQTAWETSSEVAYYYIPGNHDKFSGHTVSLALLQFYANYPNIQFDLSDDVFKATRLGDNLISMTHGDKSSVKKYPMIIASGFSDLWGKTKNRELICGHLHTEWSSSDMEGLMVRQMPTKNRPDKWHQDNGFIGSHKRCMALEYTETEPKTIYYI